MKNLHFFLLNALFTFSVVLVQTVWANSSDEIKRIVSLAPHTTELVFALGKGNQLVAVSDYSDFPIAAKELPSVADYNGVDFEAIVRLKPDLILAWKGGNKPQDLSRLNRLGYKMFYSSPHTVWDIAEEIVDLGNILGVHNKAISLSERYLFSLKELESKYRTQKPTRVFYYMWPKPLMSIGKNAWANHLLEICGAKNIFQDSISDYPEVTIEEVIRRKPAKMIAAMKIEQQDAKIWWESYKGFYMTEVIVVNPDRLHRFTPRILAGLGDLCAQIN